ncbi:hypothetical protein AGLY_010111 [Aphis glycines]|uniref:Uncharacterized protein n=1 Tax=Aphis glycines TaxID=307491 RepID=A0A6G0TF31_APHGL|nr:hypothetical protein AGLY_010111 [Aphis glycines]
MVFLFSKSLNVKHFVVEEILGHLPFLVVLHFLIGLDYCKNLPSALSLASVGKGKVACRMTKIQIEDCALHLIFLLEAKIKIECKNDEGISNSLGGIKASSSSGSYSVSSAMCLKIHPHIYNQLDHILFHHYLRLDEARLIPFFVTELFNFFFIGCQSFPSTLTKRPTAIISIKQTHTNYDLMLFDNFDIYLSIFNVSSPIQGIKCFP